MADIVQTVAPPAPPSPPLYAEPDPPPESTDTLRQRALRTFGIITGDEPAPAEPPPETPAAPPPPPAPRPPNRLPNPTQVAEQAIRDAAANLTARAAPAPAEPPASAEEDEAAKALELRLEAMDLLAENPDFAGRNLRREYESFIDKLKPYQEAWERENPGQDFDLDSADHDQWREKNAPPDLDESLISGAVTGVQSLRKMREQFHERDQRILASRLAEDANYQANTAANQVINFRPDFGAKTIEELEEKDALAAAIVEPYIARAANMAFAATQILTPGSPIKPDMSKEAHRDVLQAVKNYEARIMSLPEDQRIIDNRRYVTESEYLRLSPEERHRVWTFRYDPSAIQTLVMADLHREMNTKYEQRRPKAAKQYGGTAAPPPPPAPAAPARPPSGGTGAATIPVTAPPGPLRPHRSFFHEE